jgi:hypothetical protein
MAITLLPNIPLGGFAFLFLERQANKDITSTVVDKSAYISILCLPQIILLTLCHMKLSSLWAGLFSRDNVRKATKELGGIQSKM